MRFIANSIMSRCNDRVSFRVKQAAWIAASLIAVALNVHEARGPLQSEPDRHWRSGC